MMIPEEIERELKDLVFSPRNPYLTLDNLLRPYVNLMLRCMAAQRERDAAYLERRAGEIEADGSNATFWLARIFCDEAAAIRNQS